MIRSETIASVFDGGNVAMHMAAAGPMMAGPIPDQAVAGTGMMAGPITVEPGERFAVSRGVAVVPVRGLLTHGSAMLERYLGWATYTGLSETAATLAADDEVRGIVLHINSPGGMVVGLRQAAEALAALSAVKPVYALADPMALSAAYYLASQARTITMTPGAEVGCIGTMRQAWAPVQPDNYGEQWSIHVSSHARAKWADPTTDRGLTEIQRTLDEAEAEFHAAVASGRKIPLADLPARLSVTDDPADGGACFPSVAAIERGLADGEETAAAFYDRIMAAHAPPPTSGARRASGAYGARAAAAMAIAKT